MKIHRQVVGRGGKTGLPSLASVRRVVRASLAAKKHRLRGDINVIFVDPQTIRRLNQSFLGKNRLTDVMAFPYGRASLAPMEKPVEEIYICLSVARKNARWFNQSVEKEVMRLMIHGTLHLMGYNDTRPKDHQAMWKKQETILTKLCSNKT